MDADCPFISDLTAFDTNPGVHRCDSVQQLPTCRGSVGDHGRRAPVTAYPSGPHGSAVDAVATVLGPGSSPAPKNIRSLTSSHPVSPELILTIARSLA